MRKQTLMFVIIVFASLIFSASVVLFGSSNFERKDENHINNTSPTPTVSPEHKKATAEIIVKPWKGAIDPVNGYVDQVNGYGIQVEPVNSDGLLFRDNNVSLRINVISEYWVIQYAYFSSDIVEDKVEIPVVNSNYAIGLKASFIINFYNVPEGRHRVDFTAVLHDGTKAVAFIDFFVDT
jgi:hypothetical protein